MKELTVLEWLEYLPVKIRDKAQAYHCQECNIESDGYMNDTDISLFQALIGAFRFDTTEEGYKYWCKIANKYENFKP